MRKPQVFIASSSEATETADILQVALSNWSYPEVWTQGFFELTKTTIESLEKNMPRFDYCIFLLTPDDISVVRNEVYQTSRDNVIFELGLSTGILGRGRTFVIKPKTIDVKIPTDLLGVGILEYDNTAPNLRASLSVVSTQLKTHIRQEAKVTSMLEKNQKVINEFNKMNSLINENHLGNYNRLLKCVKERVLGCKIMREDWRIDIQYNTENLCRGTIKEKIEFDYKLINITNEVVKYPLSLMYLDDDVSCLYTMSKIDEYGKKIVIFQNDNGNLKYRVGNVVKKVQEVDLQPNTTYIVHMDFEFTHNVSKNKPFIHNSLAPIQPTIGTTVKVIIPKGFDFDLLGVDGVVAEKSQDLGNTQILNYNLPYVLLSEQIIEYIFQRKGDVNEKL